MKAVAINGFLVQRPRSSSVMIGSEECQGCGRLRVAEVSGWLVGAGKPPKSVAVTADGVRLLEKCGFI
jgi:hypothetical protein